MLRYYGWLTLMHKTQGRDLPGHHMGVKWKMKNHYSFFKKKKKKAPHARDDKRHTQMHIISEND